MQSVNNLASVNNPSIINQNSHLQENIKTIHDIDKVRQNYI